MISDDDKKAMEEIVKSTMNEILENSGINDAVKAVNSKPRMTKEEIMQVKNRRERQRLISENMDLFRK